MIHTSKKRDHIIIRMETHGYIHFICPAQPKLEMRSFETPTHCPICRRINPIEMGGYDNEPEVLQRREISADIPDILVTT